ncbi:MAG: hypothetical protein L0H70_01550, partial [Xanthomonadales bacterium]|nr:hypothetical protein [Xanthomonadales bacterium]
MMTQHHPSLLRDISRLLRRCIGLLLCLSLMALPAHALQRSYFFDHLGSDQGLAQNSVHVVFQDARGFIWIGTEGALHRFDGYHLSLYEHDPERADSLPGALITALADAPNGQLWIGTEAGDLVRFDPLRSRITARVTLPAHAVDSLFTDAQGRLWIGQKFALSVLPAAAAQVRTVVTITHTNPAFLQADVSRFAQCPDGAIYAASHDGLLHLATQDDAGKLLGPATPVAGLVCDHRNQLFISDADGIARVDRASGTRAAVWSVDPASNAVPGDLAIDHQGRLWLALRHVGLLRVGRQGQDAQSIVPLPKVAHALPKAAATRLLVDTSGLLWVGTNGAGVVRTQPNGSRFKLIRNTAAANAATANNIHSIYQDAQQRYWVGTRGSGLQRYDAATHRFTDASSALRKALTLPAEAKLSVYAMAPAAAGALWIASGRGALYFDPAAKHAHRIDLGLPRAQAEVRSVLA